MNKTAEQYAAEILSVLQDGFDSGVLSVEPESMTEFIHAMANIVPCQIHASLTNDPLELLGFNHLANRLVMQNITLIEP